MPLVVQVGVDRTSADARCLARLHAARLGERPECREAAARPLVALATCHRLELYLAGADVGGARACFARWVGGHPDASLATARTADDAARHLLRVAAGLESAVLGEDQILAQARAAYRTACVVGRPGPLLHRLFHAAFRAGRRVRAETALGTGTRSLVGAAVAVVSRALGGLAGRSVAVVGAGEMGELAARALAPRGLARLVVVNRTHERAVALAKRFGGVAEPWEWRRGVLLAVDAVVCATRATEPVLDAAALSAAGAGRRDPLLAVDLGVPPNIASEPVAGVRRIDVDGLAALQADERQCRLDAIADAEAIVDEELAAWLRWALPRGVDAGCQGDVRVAVTRLEAR